MKLGHRFTTLNYLHISPASLTFPLNMMHSRLSINIIYLNKTQIHASCINCHWPTASLTYQ
jgi:hypothetical protein